MSDKKDLLKNPLDDYVSGPTILDKASSALAEQIKQYQERAAAVIEEASDESAPSTAIAIGTETSSDGASSIAIGHNATLSYNRGPFSSSCPDFEVSAIKQSILERQWEYCRNSWGQPTMGSPYSTDGIQEILFAASVKIIKDLSLEHFIGIQPLENECGSTFTLQVKGVEVDSDDLTHLSMEIIKSVVDSRAKKLRATMTMELFQDMNAQYGDDFKFELAILIAQEVSMELYKEFSTMLYNTDYRITVDGSNDKHTALHLYKEANEIARRSHRGAGNKIIASNAVVASLIRAEAIDINNDIDKRYGHIGYVGKVGTMEVFADADMIPGEAIIVYKGGSGETDTGLFYCPHVLLSSGGMVVNPSTFQPVASLFTRHGVLENKLYNYVSRVKMTDMSYSVEDDKIITELFDKRPLRSAITSAASFYSPNMPLGREVK